MCLKFNHNRINYQYTRLLASRTKRRYIKAFRTNVCTAQSFVAGDLLQAYDRRYKQPFAFYCRE